MTTEAGKRLLGDLNFRERTPIEWITAIQAEAVAAERARIRREAAAVVSHLAFECKNSRVRQGVQMGAAAVLAIVDPEEVA